MFGYVRPITERLSEEEKTLFSSYYCGLCGAMGWRSRLMLTYDCAYLAMMCTGGAGACTQTMRCKGNPLKKKQVFVSDDICYWADVNTILSYYKVLDDIADEGKFSRRVLRLILKRDYNRAKVRSPRAEEIIGRSIREIQALERENCPVSDMAADTTARMMGCLAGEPDTPLYELFYHVGRWLYLIDALEDYEEDAARNGYNVLKLEWGSREDAVSAMEFALWHALSVVDDCLCRVDLSDTGMGVARNVLEKAMAARTHLVLYGQTEDEQQVGSL